MFTNRQKAAAAAKSASLSSDARTVFYVNSYMSEGETRMTYAVETHSYYAITAYQNGKKVGA